MPGLIFYKHAWQLSSRPLHGLRLKEKAETHYPKLSPVLLGQKKHLHGPNRYLLSVGATRRGWPSLPGQETDLTHEQKDLSTLSQQLKGVS